MTKEDRTQLRPDERSIRKRWERGADVDLLLTRLAIERRTMAKFRKEVEAIACDANRQLFGSRIASDLRYAIRQSK